MLQPRLCVSAMEFRSRGFFTVVCVAIFFSALVSCQDSLEYNERNAQVKQALEKITDLDQKDMMKSQNQYLEELSSLTDLNDNGESIEATRLKRDSVPENRDLTVLLVNDQKRPEFNAKVGRYHSVKPMIGLLTATARTFIQDGVTTEYATQILGTTLDNGRIYAQLLTKSSLVLYNKASNVLNEDVVKPTRLHSQFDGQWNVKQDLGFIDPDKFVLKNTDYLAPSKMEIVYASKMPEELKYWNAPTSPDNYAENQIYDEPTGRRVQPVNEIPRYNAQNEAFNMLDGPAIEQDKKVVVKPSILENINTLHRHSKTFEDAPEPVKAETRIKEEFNESNIVKVKPDYELPTFTIKNEFSPIFYYIDNVESRNPAHQANLQTKLPKKLFGQKSEPRPKKTFTYAGFADFTTVVGDTVIVFTPNTDTNRMNDPDKVNVYPSAKPIDKMATKITFLASDIPVATATYKPHEVNKPSKITSPKPDDNRSEKALNNDEENLKKVLYDVDDKIPDAVSVQYNNGFDFNLDVIQPSEAGFTTTERTRLTEDLEVIPIYSNDEATEPLINLKPSATILDESKESAITESDVSDMFSGSENADENESKEGATTPEAEDDEVSTTENNSSDETYEDYDPTTESEREVECTKGFETRSVMTTAYKTLTYLTTYFIPLEGTETTTSVKSDVVVESNVGYLTDVACKTEFNIEPTAVVSYDVKSNIHSSFEESEISTEEPVTTPPPKEETVTEAETEKPSVTTQKEEEVTKLEETSSSESDEIEDKHETTTATTTTTEKVLTTQERVEVSVNTEQSTTPTEKTTTESQNENENESENEVDLIYKTLYTTYTYFTTFFGDKTSSVESHKSIVTNIITSTINLSNLDPSLLGAFNEDEIAPTNVGIGRPTEAIHSIIDLVKNKDLLESVEIGDEYSAQTPTPTLDDNVVASIKPDGVKTYFTTYTFFTTIYVGSDANVCSRSEVYTNYVGPEELIPTKTNTMENTRAQFDFRNCKQVKREPQNNEETSSMESSVSMEESDNDTSEKNDKEIAANPVEVDMLLSVDAKQISDSTENSYITDVKSSSSKGERKYIENNNVFEDQISSESNIEEIMPSPTLLLQTSYTTFTYFTTMYIGKDSSKIKSRLETITNVVTETIQAKKDVEVEETNLPITYYTTFTYWTTLYKDKSTTITSREEIVSNVVTPVVQVQPTANPIDTTPIDIDTVLPPKELEVELKPSILEDSLEQDDGKATFYTTYTYFTTFYVGNTSQIRSKLETVTNIVDNTKLVDDNILGRKVPTGAADKNLIQDNGEKSGKIAPTVVKEEIQATKLPDLGSASPTMLLGTYIDNLFAEVKPAENNEAVPAVEKRILYSQIAVISGDSTIITNDNKTIKNDSITTTTTTTEGSVLTSAPDVIESSEPNIETTTEGKEDSEEEDEDDSSSRKKSRLTFTTKKPSFTPVIRPFASRNRPTFSPKRVPLLGSATIITRSEFTPTITATPSLKSVRPSGFNANRKQQSVFPSGGSTRRFTGRSNIANNPSQNVPSPTRNGFGRGSISPTSRRTGFRTQTPKNNNIDITNRSALPRIRPTATSRLRGGRQSITLSSPAAEDQNENETTGTQQTEDNATSPINEVTEAPIKTTSSPLSRFRRPLARQPGTPVTPRSTTQATTRKSGIARGRVSTTTRRTTTRTTTNPLLSLRRQRPNALFPRRNLFKQPEPEPEEEVQDDENEQSQEILDGEEFDDDNDYESSDRKEQQVSTPTTPAPKKSNAVQIRPFAFRRRTKRQVDYGNRKYSSNFRRPGVRRTEPELETEAPQTTQRPRVTNRYSARANTRATTSPSVAKSSQRQPFIVRGESRSTTSTPSYKGRRPLTRTTTSSSRPKAPRLQSNYNTQTTSRTSSRNTGGRTRTRGNTRTNSRQRNSYENHSGERQNFNHLVNDGKITITHQIPVEATIPIVNGKITEYKNIITAKPSIETLLLNQIQTTVGPLGNQQLVLATELTELADNGATRVIKFVLHETPTSTVLFTPTTIRGRKTSYSHVLPSTVYNVERVTSTLTPEINANVPLANLLLSQLLLGNQQPQINPLLALQGQGLIPQPQPIVQTPVTELKTKTTTYVTTVTDKRETVLPITFRGIPILTTIINPKIDVITATEFITETVVTTPTAVAQPQQFNSLLLAQLLQQQQQQQALALQTANPLLGLGMQDLNLVQNNNLNNDIFTNSPKPNVLTDFNSNEDYSDVQDSSEDAPPPPPPPSRPKNKPRPPKPAPPKITSVVTLYVSGRTPGEFSTVLSTVVSDDTQTVRKREAVYFEDVPVLPSILPTVDTLYSSQFDSTLYDSGESDRLIDNDIANQETQSLESILGALTDYIKSEASPTYVVKLAEPSKMREDDQSVLDDVS